MIKSTSRPEKTDGRGKIIKSPKPDVSTQSDLNQVVEDKKMKDEVDRA